MIAELLVSFAVITSRPSFSPPRVSTPAPKIYSAPRSSTPKTTTPKTTTPKTTTPKQSTPKKPVTPKGKLDTSKQFKNSAGQTVVYRQSSIGWVSTWLFFGWLWYNHDNDKCFDADHKEIVCEAKK